MENLKEYLQNNKAVFNNPGIAASHGIDMPAGVMIVGMPGCGKSLTAKCIAKEFGVPLLRLDIGRLMGKYVGESEENLRKAIRVAEATTPCILWIDEIEKAFAGLGSGGEVTTLSIIPMLFPMCIPVLTTELRGTNIPKYPAGISTAMPV